MSVAPFEVAAWAKLRFGHVSPGTIKQSTGGRVTITVTDAGARVVGAVVTYNGIKKKTNSFGQASFRIAKGTSKGRHAISFHHGGYTGGKATFRVTA